MLDSLYLYLLRFVNLTADEFTRICQFVEVQQVSKKTRLINIGERDDCLNFIIKGLARKFFYRSNEEVITQIAKENDMICSSVSFLSAVPSDYVVETIENTIMATISRDNLEKLYEMSFKMERLGRLILIDWLLQKETWESSRIKQGPQERFLNFIRDNPDLLIRVPQKFLASYLNIKPETFSRYKHLLVKRPESAHPKSLDLVTHH